MLLPVALIAGLCQPASVWALEPPRGEPVSGGEVRPLSEEEGFELLKSAGGEEAWPDLKEQPSLLEFAFSTQATMPTPSGGMPTAGKVVSQRPYITVFDDFLSEQECDFLQTFAKSRLSPAMVVKSGDNWYETETQTRNNEQKWLTAQEEKSVPGLLHIVKRMHRATRIPDEHAEGLQVGRYNATNKYEIHLDTDPAHGVDRPVTLITYLSDVVKGGDTLFPVDRTDCSAAWHTDPETGEKSYGAQLCCNTPEKDTPRTVRVSPKKGRAVMFFNHFPDGSVDETTRHIGCPVVEGVKWIAQRWFRFNGYNNVDMGVGTNGFDPRFDGVPPDEDPPGSAPEAGGESGLWKVSDKSPRLFLQRAFVDDAGHEHLLVRARQLLESTDEAWLPPGDVASDPVLAALAADTRQLARLQAGPLTPPPAIRFRRLRAGAGGEALGRDSPPSHGTSKSTVQLATVAVQLTAAEEGGAMAFPEAQHSLNRDTAAQLCGKVEEGGRTEEDLAACCAAEGLLKLRPRRRDAVLLFSHNVGGDLDTHSAHVICPVERGESIVAEFSFIYPNFKVRDKTEIKTGSKADITVEFVNVGAEPLNIFWVPQRGDESSMGVVPVDGKTPFNTFAGHVWNFRDDAGALVQEVTITAGSGHKIINVGVQTEL